MVSDLLKELERVVETTASTSQTTKHILEMEHIVWERQLPMNDKDRLLLEEIDHLNELEQPLTDIME